MSPHRARAWRPWLAAGLGAACLLAAAALAAFVPLPASAAPADLAAPARFAVAFHTTNGDFVIQVHRDWAPHGADRFYTLVKAGYYQGNAFYRVIPHFVAQWGLSPLPARSAAWSQQRLPDDPVLQSNRRGRGSFAADGRNSRTTQVFVNLADNPRLDNLGFAPFGQSRGSRRFACWQTRRGPSEAQRRLGATGPPSRCEHKRDARRRRAGARAHRVSSGMSVLDTLAADYGEVRPGGHGPDPRLILAQGAAYLTRNFPRLDVIYSAGLLP
ncbi:MAG TPA: peptidylprolyl isomerase [Terriglobales bacterium]|nr:peptidylprolyl isomerase [Terriglobales bacterium]